MLIFAVKDNSMVIPGFLQTDINTNVEFKCTSYGNASWYHVVEEEIQTAQINSNTLRLFRVTNDDKGRYFCAGHYLTTQIPFLAIALLLVYGK